jgi:spore coat polysaccharide biosynthesis protein SpsF
VIVASIQARMGSTRLPGKVLADVCGKPMLLWQVERIRKSRLIDKVVVATTTSSKDDQIEQFCIKNKISFYRGSEEDVLKRISSLIKDFKINLHLEFCGDTPLSDPQIIDEFIGYYFKNQKNADFVTSAPKTTYPAGFEISLYPGDVLIAVDERVCSDDPLREHVGYNITRFPKLFRTHVLEAPEHFTSPETYIEVDTVEDLNFIRQLVGYFLEEGKEHFGLAEILTFLKNHPELTEINKNVQRRWKALYS